jgi:hypothetical protein
MNEFNNRIDAQRRILSLVNSRPWREELYGLSVAAIERWIHANGLDPRSALPATIYASADKLFFLANKSQEQITEEYRLLASEVRRLGDSLAALLQSSYPV